MTNPRRRKRRSRMRNPRRRRARGGYRRNPLSLKKFSVGNVSGQVMGALPGAVGALGLDVLLGVLPIPVTWKAGIFGYATKIVGAIGLGMIAKTVVSEATASRMTTGALTVMFHGIMRDFVATNVPSVPLGMYMLPRIPAAGLGYYGSGWNPAGAAHMGAYLPDISGGDDMESLAEQSYY